ncbi:MAG: hypothetical protein A2Y79_01180 [Deltaproteobacteria bacterium RBG_13_43_22]|jgi:hypothetical protein|nr:MAG: hypothetical protein A2Y79_01180 [Deltaproteobacteria bacterium RBG_13_43_22]
MEKQFAQLANEIVHKVSTSVPDKQQAVVRILRDSEVAQLMERFMSSRTLSELYLHREDWALIHERWRESEDFQSDLAALSSAGLVEVPDGVVLESRLTHLGTTVAERLAAQTKLWNQLEPNKEQHDADIAQRKKANKRIQRTP